MKLIERVWSLPERGGWRSVLGILMVPVLVVVPLSLPFLLVPMVSTRWLVFGLTAVILLLVWRLVRIVAAVRRLSDRLDVLERDSGS